MKQQEKELVPGQVYYLDNMKEDWGIFKEYDDKGNLWFTPLKGSNYLVDESRNVIGFAALRFRDWEIKED
jgi:hypothetical protein